jgi:hypothetical protein
MEKEIYKRMYKIRIYVDENMQTAIHGYGIYRQTEKHKGGRTQN